MGIARRFHSAGTAAAAVAGFAFLNAASPGALAAGGDVLWSQNLTGTVTPNVRIANEKITAGGVQQSLRGRDAMKVNAAGDLLIVGSVLNGAPAGYDWRVAKLNGASGAVTWSQNYDSGTGDDHPYTLALDGAGNAIVVGLSRNAAGHNDWRVRKYAAADGALVWDRTIVDAGDDAALLVAADADGNAVAAGVVHNGTDLDIKVVKFAAADGAVLWQRTIAGDGEDGPYAIAIDPATQDAVVAGMVGNAGLSNHYTARLATADGAMLWQQARAGHAGGSAAFDLAIDSTGAIVTAGTGNLTDPQSNQYDQYAIAVKYAADGTELWAKTFNHADPQWPIEAYTLRLATNDDAFIAGYTIDPVRVRHDGWMARIAPGGTTLWENAPLGPGYDIHIAMALGSDGHPVTSDSNSGVERMIVRKFNQKDGGHYWGDTDFVGGTSLLYEPFAIAAAGTSVWVYGVALTSSMTPSSWLHVRRFDNPAIGNEPSKITFKEQFKEPNEIATSETVTVSGITGALPILIDAGEYSKGCNGTFTSAPGTVVHGDTLCVRHVVAPDIRGVRITTIQVGTTPVAFKSTAKWAVTVTVALSTDTIGYLRHTYNASATVTSAHGTPTGNASVQRERVGTYDNQNNPIYSTACSPAPLNNGSRSCNTQSSLLGPMGHRAFYAGNADFQPGYSPYVTLTTVPNAQWVVGFGPQPDRAVGTTYTMRLETNETLAVQFASETPATCQVTNPTSNPRVITLLALGECTIRAEHAGSTGFLPAPPVYQSFQVKNDQAIDFAALPNKVYEDPPLTLSAPGGSSGNPVTFSSSTLSVCTTTGTNGMTLTIVGAGACTVAADQAGTPLYLTAIQKVQSFTVAKFPQAIAFAELANRQLGGPAVALSSTVTGSSGIPVVYASQTPAVCTTSRTNGATLTLRGLGTCSVTANRAGNGNYVAAPQITRSFTVSQADVARADLNGDGKSDILWRNASTGLLRGLGVNGLSPGAGGVMDTLDTAWKTAATGDFNGDGRVDVVYRHDTTGQLHAQLLRDFTVIGQGVAYTLPDLQWQVAGSGDFNSDGKSDLLLRNAQTGQLFVLLMNGLVPSGGSFIYTEPGPNWLVAGVGDFNDDGRADVLYRNGATGQLRVLLMNTFLIAAQGSPYTQANLDWKVAGVGDFNGDGKDDILYRNEATGDSYLLLMNGTAVASQGSAAGLSALDWTIVAVADYDGNGRADTLWRSTSTGQVHLILMNGFAATAQGVIYTESDANWVIVGK